MSASLTWPTAATLSAEFNLIKQARAAVAGYKKDLAPGTVQTYARIVKRIRQEMKSHATLDGCTLIESLLARRSQKANSFMVARSALTWTTVSQLRSLLQEQDRVESRAKLSQASRPKLSH